MADGNVVSLNGQQIVPPGTVRPELVTELKKLLAMAESGEIDGIAYAATYYDDATGSDQVGRVTRSMLGSIELLKHLMCKEINDAG